MVLALLAWRDRQLDWLQRSPRIENDDVLATLTRTRIPSQTADDRSANETTLSTPRAAAKPAETLQTHQHPPETPLLVELGLKDRGEEHGLPPTPPLPETEELPDLSTLNLAESEIIASHMLKKVCLSVYIYRV